MQLEQEGAQLLGELGLAETQVRLYLALLKTGETDVKNLSKHSSVPRTEIYRTLGELQQKGLVEKQIGTPYTFQSIPIGLALRILVNQKVKAAEEVRKKTNETAKKIDEFLLEFQENEAVPLQRQDYKFILIDGRERLIHKLRLQHDSAQHSVDILSTLPRWLQVTEECFDNCENALNRGVNYRVILETPTYEASFPKNVQPLLSKPNFNLKLVRGFQNNNSAIFDGKEANFNFYPSKSLSESPLLWTNHPTFLSMTQEHFENIWNSARKYKP